MKALRKAVVILLIAFAAAPTLSLIVLDQYYYSKRPREPHPEAGRVYVKRAKGVDGVADVYLTRVEKWPFDYAPWLMSTSMAFALVAYLVNQHWRCFPPFRDDMPRGLTNR